MPALAPPATGDWVALSDTSLPDPAPWAAVPSCGAVVTFIGTVRDHADGREGVTSLDYEAYEEPAVRTMVDIVADARAKWPVLGRVAALHRTGHLELGDTAVVVAVSAPHRGEAFEAAEWIIDTIKATAPIWKKETWAGGSDWAHAAPLTDRAGRS